MSPKTKNALLWKIIDPNNPNQVSYLLGTIHIQSQFAFANLHIYKELILKCDAYAGESNLDELSQFELDGQFDPSYAVQYKAILSENQYQHLDRFIRKEIPQIHHMWLLFHPLLLMSQMEMVLMGSDEPQSLDMTIWEFAKAVGKELLAIESATMQQDIFKDIDLDTAFRNVKSAVSNLSKMSRKYKKLAHYYQVQDIQALYLSAKKQLGKMKHMMLYDRNVFMANRIEELIHEKSVFIGIGVGHLPGQKGVLRLLKKKGFFLRPIDNSQMVAASQGY